MNELLQTGDERDRELTAEEWEKVGELVDKIPCSCYEARLILGLELPSDRNAPSNSRLSSGQSISVNKKTPPCERSRFDTRTQQAHDASGQGPLTEKQKQTNRDGIAMARAALRNARAA